MNERDEDLRWQEPRLEPTAKCISGECAEKVNFVHDLKGRIGAGVEAQFQPFVSTAQQTLAKVIDWLEMKIAHACEVERRLEQAQCGWVEGRLQAAQGCVDLCAAKMMKYLNRTRKKKEMDDPRVRTCLELIAPNRYQPDAHLNATEPAPSGAEPPLEAIMGTGPNPFPPPPSKKQLRGLVWPLADGQSMIELDQLPTEFWVPLNAENWWLSLSPSVVARVQGNTIRIDGNSARPEGNIFVNFADDRPMDAIKSLLSQLGISEGSYLALTLEEAWQAAIACFGPVLSKSLWDELKLPHPPTEEEMRPFRDLPPVGQTNGVPTEPVRPLEPPFQPVGPRPGFPVGIGPKVDPEFVQFGLPQLPNPIQAMLDRLRLPTQEEVCALVNPLYAALNIPPAVRWPCATMAEVNAYLQAQLLRNE